MAEERAARRLSKMGSGSRGTSIPIRSNYSSLIDMINQRGGEYPSQTVLDAYNHSSKYRNPDTVKELNKLYNVPFPFKLVPAEAGDRSCHWKPDARGNGHGAPKRRSND